MGEFTRESISKTLQLLRFRRSKVDVGTAEAPEEPLDEAVRLEARRKRREAIKAKYRGQDSLRIQALHQGADSELTSGTPMSATGKSSTLSSFF